MLEGLPIMLALCFMLWHAYYAQNYAGIIDAGLACAVHVSDLNLVIEEQSAEQLEIYNLNGRYFISHTFNSTW